MESYDLEEFIDGDYYKGKQSQDGPEGTPAPTSVARKDTLTLPGA